MDDTEFVHSVADVCGWSVRGVRFIDSAGSVNQVARVSIAGGEVIVRFHRDPLRANEFAVESWCSRAAAGVGVPTPAVLADGVLDGKPYGVEEFVGWSSHVPGRLSGDRCARRWLRGSGPHGRRGGRSPR